jgi:hypothetical protein
MSGNDLMIFWSSCSRRLMVGFDFELARLSIKTVRLPAPLPLSESERK